MSSAHDNFVSPSVATLIIKNQQTFKAYVQTQTGWVEGFVTVVNGFVTNCQFPNNGRLTARIYENTRPSALNPNNQMAIQNNFTHYIDIPNYGRAYFTATSTRSATSTSQNQQKFRAYGLPHDKGH